MAALEDRDLQSIQEVRGLIARVHAAQASLEKLPQPQIDAIVAAMAAAALAESRRLAAMAVEETGYGNPEDKHLKNSFVATRVASYIQPLRTVGIIAEDTERRVTEVAMPMGVVAAIIPSTNPTSTAIFKCLISLKGGNGVVLSPHPAAVRSIGEAARVCHEAAVRAGAPEGIIGCTTTPTLEATQELMKHRKTAIILATGGAGLVKAAYSSGKPAYGVGPGNVPAYVDRSADPAKAVKDIVTGKTFDHGTLCSSEQSIVVDRPIEAEVVRQLERYRGHFLDDAGRRKLEAIAIQSNGSLNPQVVGKSPQWIAERAGITIPAGTRLLVVRLSGVGREHPLSCEKLSPILAFYVVEDWREGCERCKQILAYGGMGHTLGIHCQDRDVIREFGLQKPAFRICVNTPATHGSIGLSTSLPPSMTLGCGTHGNNITTDNITPLHLIQVKRVAWGITEASPSWLTAEEPAASSPAPDRRRLVEQVLDEVLGARANWARAPKPPRVPPPPSEPAGAARAEPRPEPPRDEPGRAPVTAPPPAAPAPSAAAPPAPAPSPAPASTRPAPPAPAAVEFVCEQDVRGAIQARSRIYVNARTIITPAARDLGTAHSIFTVV